MLKQATMDEALGSDLDAAAADSHSDKIESWCGKMQALLRRANLHLKS